MTTTAEAWAEGFEAGATWTQSTPSGVPVDPPTNPYEDDGIVSTIRDLDALPDDTVVRDDEGDVYVRAFEGDGNTYWWSAGTANNPHPSHVIDLPVVVLYRGETDE